MSLIAAAVASLLVPLALPPLARAQPSLVGEWSTLPYTMPVNPIHAALLRTGKVLIVAGSENDPDVTTYRAAVWEPRTGAIAVQEMTADLFCNAISSLPDGRVLVVGGTQQYDPFRGLRTTAIFDPLTERFVQVEDMAHGRWYPTNTALADGGTLTFSGITGTGGTNRAIEIYDVGFGWSPEYQAPWIPPLYPRVHLLPSGRLFFSGPMPSSHLYDPATDTWALDVAQTRYGQSRAYGASVLLPLRASDGFRPRVMILGGRNPATATVEVIDLAAPTPTWAFAQPMSSPRIQLNAVILATGRVLALGGSAIDSDEATAALAADLYDPDSGTWVPAGIAAYPRLYHAVALLLPDARVAVAGSNPRRGTWEPNVEIYSPAYLFTGTPRPRITGVPEKIGYGLPFTVSTPEAPGIRAVALVRPGATTHAFDMEQRLVELAFTAGAGRLTVTAPPSASVAPPGYYMLFLVDAAGVPSVAAFVQLSPAPANRPPVGRITSPAADVTINTAQTLTFAGEATDADGGASRYAWIFPGGTPGSSQAAAPGPVAFPNPGTYVVSLTVADEAGENDPSPPTRTVTVLPAPAMVSLTVTPQGSGLGTVTSLPAGIGCPGDCVETYPKATLVELHAAPEPGSHFAGWSGACTGSGHCTVSLDADATVTAGFVADRPTVTVGAADATARELGRRPAVFVVRRTGPVDAELTVRYAVGGTAAPGLDYAPLPGVVTIPAGSDAVTVQLTPIPDALVEPAEDVVITLTPADGYVVGTPAEATAIIAADVLLPFQDVPAGHWARIWIETLYAEGVASGCQAAPPLFCPEAPLTRAEMAVLLLRAAHGAAEPPPPRGRFADVPPAHWAAAWIEWLAAQGITGGCGGDDYCPDRLVTRAEMAVFLVRARYGPAIPLPAATAVFDDVPVGHWAAPWIEQLARTGVTGGCSRARYCPDAPVTRAQMAVFLSTAFALPR